MLEDGHITVLNALLDAVSKHPNVYDYSELWFSEARDELRIRTELCDATAAWMEWLIAKHGNDDWKCPYVAAIAEKYKAYKKLIEAYKKASNATQ